MEKYHSYIYDVRRRRIVGDFEGAYRNCEDVWPGQHQVALAKHRVVVDLIRSLGPKPRVADIGSGYGDFVAELVRQGVDVTGYEISPTAVERGRERFGLGDRLQVANLKDGIPAADASYDLVILFGVLWFLVDHLDEALREVKRLLKPGAWVAVSATMIENPIGGEVIRNADDMLAALRRYFSLREAILVYLDTDVAAGKPLRDCGQDMVVFGIVE